MKAAEWERLPEPIRELRTKTVPILIHYLSEERHELVVLHDSEMLGAINDCMRKLRKLMRDSTPEWRTS